MKKRTHQTQQTQYLGPEESNSTFWILIWWGGFGNVYAEIIVFQAVLQYLNCSASKSIFSDFVFIRLTSWAW